MKKRAKKRKKTKTVTKTVWDWGFVIFTRGLLGKHFEIPNSQKIYLNGL
jgi:hypothetical protein